MKKNDLIEIEITGMSSEGSGVGRSVDGMAVFVPFSAIGDKIICRVVRVEKSHAFGRVEEILEASPDRIEVQDEKYNSGCGVFGQCGGCTTRHVEYAAELRYKWQRVTDALQRVGGLDVVPRDIVGSEQYDGYRNKAQYPVAAGPYRAMIGFFAPRSHRVVENHHCLLQPECFGLIVDMVAKWMKKSGATAYDEAGRSGLVRHIYVRRGEISGEVMVCLVCTSGKLPEPDMLVESLREAVPSIVSVMVNLNPEDTNIVLGTREYAIWGQEYLTDTLCGLKFRLSPRSFYQVNRSQAERLYGLAAEYAGLSGKETVLDLYCGTGTIGLSMAAHAGKIIGVEVVDAAVEDARRNAVENKIENARFICADAAGAAAQLRDEGTRPDVVILDPPRKGCDAAVVSAVAGMSPAKVVYISCDPATLARDLARFAECGYCVREVTPVDMFPRTSHVETVVLLSKLKSTTSIEVKIDLDEMDLSKAESKATYDEIKQYVLDKFGFKVSQLYIAQVKRKHGIIERDNYNVGDGKSKVPQVPADKEKAIVEALRYFKMI